MNNPVCAACGHANRAGAEACEMCDARLYAPAWDEGPAEPLGGGGEATDPAGGPSWSTSEPFSSEPFSSEPFSAEPSAGPGGASPADDIPAPPFKGAGDVISPMLAVYRKHFTLVGILVLVAMIPEALLQFGFISLMDGRALLSGAVAGSGGVGAASGGTALMLVAAASGLILALLAMVCGALLTASLVYAVVDLQRTGRSSAGECLARALKSLPKVLLITVISAAVTMVGYLLLIVPGVIVSLMLSVAVPAAVVEGLGPIAALKRSRELTDGYKGLIFVTYFLWGLLIIVLNWVVTWSFANSAGSRLDALPLMLIQTAVTGMLNSSTHVLTAYIYLGLLRERRSAFSTHTFTPGPQAAA